MKREEKTIAKNKKAFHEYEILETLEAGIELTGTEVRSLRDNHCQLTDCFALIRDGEVWLHNVHKMCIRDRPHSHSPHGECGLKCHLGRCRKRHPASLPAWGVRVEMCLTGRHVRSRTVTPRMGSAG